jgi:hypothetical protein
MRSREAGAEKLAATEKSARTTKRFLHRHKNERPNGKLGEGLSGTTPSPTTNTHRHSRAMEFSFHKSVSSWPSRSVYNCELLQRVCSTFPLKRLSESSTRLTARFCSVVRSSTFPELENTHGVIHYQCREVSLYRACRAPRTRAHMPTPALPHSS